ncbi:hypothetical protein [Anaerosinus massiliensis]|uniref:hypothetical protein n=1 Tax=Massilibacillus massiliensis TaxID=1806837 RepID=UPI000DA6188F|nr:hypothetical protein [Massilibacillus massiliensis]
MDAYKNKIPKNCPYLSRLNCSKDRPTAYAGLGTRFIFTILAWFVLGLNITPGSSFFVSLLLFSAPLFLEYKKFIPNTRLRRIVHNIGKVISGSMVLISAIGLFGILVVTVGENSTLYLQVAETFIICKGYIIPLNFIWCLVGTAVFITGLDWIIYEGVTEKQYIEYKCSNKKG